MTREPGQGVSSYAKLALQEALGCLFRRGALGGIALGKRVVDPVCTVPLIDKQIGIEPSERIAQWDKPQT